MHICVRAARPSGGARCGAGAGCSAIQYQSLAVRWRSRGCSFGKGPTWKRETTKGRGRSTRRHFQATRTWCDFFWTRGRYYPHPPNLSTTPICQISVLPPSHHPSGRFSQGGRGRDAAACRCSRRPRGSGAVLHALQGHLAHKKTPTPRTTIGT